jgi:phosphatidylglycerol---prolipoprotein diacylglyceryl transferase
MYPDLSYILADFFESPIDNWASIFKTYGTLLVITFLICSYLLRYELKKQSESGKIPKIKISTSIRAFENLLIIILVTLIGYKVVYLYFNINEFNNFKEIVISVEGNIWGAFLFFIFSLLVLYRYENETKKNEYIDFYKLTYGLSLVIIIFSLVGMKVIGILECDVQGKSFISLLNECGTAFYGGLLGGLLGGFIFCKFYNFPFSYLLDSIAPVMMFGYSFGRVACHLSGDGCWGVENHFTKPIWLKIPNWLWAYNYPHNVINCGIKIKYFEGKYAMVLDNPVYPTSLYEAIYAFGAFYVILRLRAIITKPYHLFITFIMLLAFERFIIGFIRNSSKYTFLGLHLSQAQYISLFFLCVLPFYIIYRRKII